MKRALTLLWGIATVCLVAYLSWLNPAEVEFRLTPTYKMPGHLGSLMVFALTTHSSFSANALRMRN